MRKKIILILIVLGSFALAVVIFYFFFLNIPKRYLIGADSASCQNTSKLMNMYGGSSGEVQRQMVTIDFMGKKILVHQKAASSFLVVAEQIKKEGIDYSFNDVQTFAWRSKVTSSQQSLHSFGIAVDVNPGQNPYVYTDSTNFRRDIPERVVKIFEENGFYWGGNWPGFKDPMHFEWYGGEIDGAIIGWDKKVVPWASVFLDGKLYSEVSNANYSVISQEGLHSIKIRVPNYIDYDFNYQFTCNEKAIFDVFPTPMPQGATGSIKGKVENLADLPLKMPAQIYVDDIYSTVTDFSGSFFVPAVASGYIHSIKASVYPMLSGEVKVEVAPGKVGTANLYLER